MIKNLILLFFLCCLFFNSSYGQNDSLIFKNKDVIVGEIKSMDRGVVIIETDYSDSDFEIEWEKISEVYSTQNYLITLTSGRRHNGYLKSSSPNRILIHTLDGETIEVDVNEIVYFKTYEDDFISRLSANIDINYSFTKANNLTQSGLRTSLGYVAPRWSASAGYNLIRSNQDEVDPIRREDGSFSYRKFLPKDWYVPANYSFLSNTEQKLDLRSIFKLGMGKYIIHTNQSYFGVEGGFSYVNERFSSEDEDRNSMEAYVGSELNLYDIGDLDLLTKAVIFPGITESGRWRFDYNIDVKYDLPLELYIKAGFTLNYDNQVVEGASKADYVFQTGIGWEL